MNNSIWLEKYKPHHLKDITTNVSAAKAICAWFETFEKLRKTRHQNKDEKKVKKTHEKSCLLLTGGHGVGKTVTIEVILKHLNYEQKNIDAETLKNGKKNPKEIISKLVRSFNILNMIDGSGSKKLAIVIDEIEAISSPTEKKFITSLQKLNDTFWYCPIIFISNGHHNKLLSEIKKNSTEIRFFSPYPSDMLGIILRVTRCENIKLDDDDTVEKILEHAQGDIRRLILTFQELKYAYKTTLITSELMEEYCKTSKNKDIDPDIYKATEKLLYNYSGIEPCLRLFETEKTIIPLMVHQHYIKSISTNYKDDVNKSHMVKTISNLLSTGDVVENYIYGDQNWELQEIQGFYACVIPSFNMSKNIVEEPEKIKLKFANDLNKTSIKKINKKNIKNTDKCFQNMNIFDYIYINKIIKKFLAEGDIPGCVELLKGYNIKLEHIESLLKIDKIKNTKTTLSAKQKNEFTKYLV